MTYYDHNSPVELNVAEIDEVDGGIVPFFILGVAAFAAGFQLGNDLADSGR